MPNENEEPSRVTLEEEALTAVALGKPEAADAMKRLKARETPREALEASALRAVALGLPEADDFIARLRGPCRTSTRC